MLHGSVAQWKSRGLISPRSLVRIQSLPPKIGKRASRPREANKSPKLGKAGLDQGPLPKPVFLAGPQNRNGRKNRNAPLGPGEGVHLLATGGGTEVLVKELICNCLLCIRSFSCLTPLGLYLASQAIAKPTLSPVWDLNLVPQLLKRIYI